MAGGQQITSGQGTLTVADRHGQEMSLAQGAALVVVTLALSGAAIASGQGTVSANNDGTVALVGIESAVSTGIVAPTWGQDITGSESTTGIGSVTIVNNPSTSAGQAITSGAGTVTPEGNSVTVNITGEEFTSATGFLQGGTQPITTLVSTVSAGTATPDFSFELTGIASTIGQGAIGVGQDADDTYIRSSHGNAGVDVQFELLGIAIVGTQGNVTVTGDITVNLTGEASASGIGDLAFSFEFPLTGVFATAQQQSMGAPGGASLTGAEATVIAGQIFTDNDRSFALTGQQFTVGQGDAVTSYLAFATGQVINVEQQEIGPRGATLTGQQINSEHGYVEAPHKDMGAGKPKGRKGDKGKDGKPLRFKVKIDDELFIVSSREEAEELYAQAKELAAAQAEQQAAAVVTGRKNVASENKTALNTEPVKLDLPQVIPDDNEEAMDFASKLKSDLDQIYQRAAIEAEIAIRLEKQRLLDEEENLVLLLLNQ